MEFTSAAHLPALLFIFSAFLFPALVVSVGINYGQIANNLPTPENVVPLVKNIGASRVKLYDADPKVLKAFANTGVEFIVGLGNEYLSKMRDPSNAQAWVKSNVQAYLPATKITSIAVGNEVLTFNDTSLSGCLLPAMQSVHTALVSLNLDKQVTVTTAHSLAILESSYPPSSGAFRRDLKGCITPILDFLSNTCSPFLINAYPFFAYKANPKQVSLDFVLFQPNSGIVDPGTNLHYDNMLFAQIDAVYAAMSSLGFKKLPVQISETGWPSKGDEDEVGATPDNAKKYNGNLLKLISQKKGTPARPSSDLNIFVFALFNENMKTGPTSERNYGLFKPDGTPAYNIGFSGNAIVSGNSTSSSSSGSSSGTVTTTPPPGNSSSGYLAISASTISPVTSGIRAVNPWKSMAEGTRHKEMEKRMEAQDKKFESFCEKWDSKMGNMDKNMDELREMMLALGGKFDQLRKEKQQMDPLVQSNHSGQNSNSGPEISQTQNPWVTSTPNFPNYPFTTHNISSASIVSPLQPRPQISFQPPIIHHQNYPSHTQPNSNFVLYPQSTQPPVSQFSGNSFPPPNHTLNTDQNNPPYLQNNHPPYTQNHWQNSWTHRPPKMDFPKFDGMDPRGWAIKCDQYFEFNPMEDLRKARFASTKFEGRASHWYQYYHVGRGLIPWVHFVNDVIAKFATREHKDPQAEFNKLKQTTTVEAYIDEFEVLRALIVVKQVGLNEDYFFSSFISGLREDIKGAVKMSRPESLEAAMELAKEAEYNLRFHKPKVGVPVRNTSYIPNTKPPVYSSYTKTNEPFRTHSESKTIGTARNHSIPR